MKRKPIRIQRRRAKGWTMPDGAVYVGRPTKWGNPFEVGVHGTRAECVELYVFLAAGYLNISATHDCVDAQRAAQRAIARAKQELRGKDLACWCPPSVPCHGDVLLAIANDRPLPKHIHVGKLTRLG